MSYGQHDKMVSGLICEKDLSKIREAVCIQTEKIYDSCKDKDCIEDARVIFKDPDRAQWLVNHALSVKCRKAEVVSVYADAEAVPFKKGFYTVDVKFFIVVTLDFYVPKPGHAPGMKVVTVPGLVVFDKKVILFGSEGNVKIFKSHYVEDGLDTPVGVLQQDNLPITKVEVAEPICLNARIMDILENIGDDCDCCIPKNVSESLFDFDFDVNDYEHDDDDRHIIERRFAVVTIGLFSIIKLVRLVQLLIPAFDFCVPNKTCIASTEENPCELFDTIEFPTDEFFPPQIFDFPGAEEEENHKHNG